MIERAAGQPRRAILPEFGGRGGHPILIPPDLVDSILQFSTTVGLRGYWRAHPEAFVRLPVDDSAVIEDIDTPDQLPDAESRRQ